MSIIYYFIGHFLIICTISIILFVILISFLYQFALPAMRIKKDLQATIDRLKQIKSSSKGFINSLEEISGAITADDKLSHPWHEYRESLHEQRSLDAQGKSKTIRWRSTALAETFFTEQALVDTPLRTEFYKHLPGILTGLGIIGTFSGLIVGLIRFEVSGDADKVRASLNGLIQSVGYSFVVSASAISLAMMFIWMEKSLVTGCYRYVEKLCQIIDSLFNTGAGEEYLARLVAASETSASHVQQIKNSLTIDLKQALLEISTQQAEASALLNKQLSENFAQTLIKHIRGPMERISLAVENVNTNQGEAMNKIFSEALTNITVQTQDTLGNQLQEIGELLQQSAITMQSASIQINQFSENIHTTEKGAAEAMISQLNTAISSFESRQQAMDTHMVKFVDHVSGWLQNSQSETSHKMESFIEELGSKITDIIAKIESQSRQTTKEYGVRQNQFAEHTTAAMNGIHTQIQTLAGEMCKASEIMRSSVVNLSQSTKESISMFSSGADTLNKALNGFAKTGLAVSNTMHAANNATEKIQIASSHLVQATTGVQDMLAEYRSIGKIFATIVSDLKSTIENARHEASMTTQIVARIQKATEQLGVAEDKAQEYLHGITEVLAQAHAEFAGNIELTLRKSNSQFHEELSKSVSLISGAIQDFGDVLDSVKDNGDKQCWV
jgi:hypothetical protein